MPLIEQPSYWNCDRCGLAVGYVVNEVEDPEEDPGVPPNWLRLDIRRVIVNPDLADFHAAVNKAIEDAAVAMAGETEVTDEHRNLARSLVTIDAPAQYITEEASYALCHECAPYIADIGVEDYGKPPEDEAEAQAKEATNDD